MNLTFSVKKNLDFVFDYLTEIQKFVSVHPVITKIDQTGDHTYLVYETLTFGFIPFSFTYPVTIQSNPLDHTVIIYATVMKFTKIEMHFALKQNEDFTVVQESVLFESPLPIKLIMEGIFKKQHTQLFKNIALVQK